MEQSAQEVFRRLAIGDPRMISAIGDLDHTDPVLHRLDERTEALLQIGALVALDAPQLLYQAAVGAAQRSGASPEDLLAVLVAVAGVVGSARVVSAAPRVALAAGYDIEAALERNDQFESEIAASTGRP